MEFETTKLGTVSWPSNSASISKSLHKSLWLVMDFLLEETGEWEFWLGLNNDLISDGQDSVFHIPEIVSLLKVKFHEFVVLDFNEVLGVLLEGDSLTGNNDKIRVETNKDRTSITSDNNLVLFLLVYGNKTPFSVDVILDS